jgi:demethylmenaquinone methyltransferase/2-methoxy-6-polyprenyl-1,4-benzoquinol methylase
MNGSPADPSRVRGMLGLIVHRYDLLNHLLSFQLDRLWRARTARRVYDLLRRPGARVLDLCCGTGDLMIALEKNASARIFGGDFCHPMLIEARRKVEARRGRAVLFEADALALPLSDASLDLITIAFGFRNLGHYRNALVELRRVLRPGGALAILEFSQPPNRAFAALYGFYATRILPRIGGLLSGHSDAYAYLPESVCRFPGPEDLASQMREAGFADVSFDRMTLGIVALHLGRVATSG